MNENNGFTLIELLAVILILGIIALIAIPTVNSIIKESKRGAFETSANNIIGAIEDACELQNLKGETLTEKYTFTDGSVTPELNVKGKLPNNGIVEVDSMCNTTANINNGKFSALKVSTEDLVSVKNEVIVNPAYTNGTVVYFNPVTGSKCDLSAYTANTGASNNGTKTGCMKWYTFNDEGSTSLSVNLILDHNTTEQVSWNSTGSSSGGMKEVETKLIADTSTWKSVLDSRLITANEVAKIIEYNGWTTGSTWFYFASKTTSQLATCTSPTFTGCNHKWLYDRTSTDSATTYGSLNNASSSTNGYWTSSIRASNSTEAWRVHVDGSLGSSLVSNTSRGVRPVITVLKSKI